jgi:hypothetical protein
VRKFFARIAGTVLIGVLYLLLPLLPLLATVIFARLRFTTRYLTTLKKMRVHIAALSQGPAVHFFQDILGQVSQVPDDIQGECVQCGNCCMNHQCVFLEKVDEKKFQCGVYHSPFRKLSNCGSFPINRHDIERYACPSYFAQAPQASAISRPQRVIPIEMVKG